MSPTPLRQHASSTTSVGSRKARGFTLIEILVVVVVIGILAAVAVPHFSRAREKALVAAMTADLRAAAFYEELYAAGHAGTYFSGAATDASPLEGFQTSKDITVTLTVHTPSGSPAGSGMEWNAVARHAGTSKQCEMSGGRISCLTREDVATGEIPPD